MWDEEWLQTLVANVPGAIYRCALASDWEMQFVSEGCDAYDAMVSERPYDPARTSNDARLELAGDSGTQFDPAVVSALSAEIGAAAGNLTGVS